MSKSETKRQIALAAAACAEKKAEEISILEMEKSSSAFTDYMLICHGSNPRQVQAIADEVELRLKRDSGMYPNQVEGYKQAEWVLLDYVDFVLHIFSANARKFYDLERLWRNARRVTIDDLAKPTPAQEEGVAAAGRSRRPSRPKTAAPVKAALAGSARRSTRSSKKKGPSAAKKKSGGKKKR